MTVTTFDWSQEINQVVTKSLVTTFGLDFLLLEDKKGGDVDTIHNVRQGIWATEEERQKYEQQEAYDSHAYHQHENYIKKGRDDKKQQQDGTLKDGYRKDKKLTQNQKRDLDHVISAYEVHHDAGRVLAGLYGVELANQDSNLSSTLSSINRTKKQHSVEDFLQALPKTINNRESELLSLSAKLETMPQNTPKQKHEYQETQYKIRKKQQSLDELKQVDPDEIRKVDAQARGEYNKKINSYYSSSKFFSSSFAAAINSGFKMGLRESMGLILAEMWFEIKETIPKLYENYKNTEFKIFKFLDDLKQTIINVFERVKSRFKDVINSFKDGAISGVFSNITTTILNIFLTTTKFWGKIIRETWLNIVNVTKLAFFNPENLTTGQLAKATFTILSASIGVIVGMLVNESLVVVASLPFGAEVRMFLTALATGIVTLGLNYFIDQSPMMQKFWAYLDGFKTKYERILEHFNEINFELDRYILELTQLEFAIDVVELESFSENLKLANSELERHVILKQKIEQQSIKLPFEMGNSESAKNWLLGLSRKKET